MNALVKLSIGFGIILACVGCTKKEAPSTEATQEKTAANYGNGQEPGADSANNAAAAQRCAGEIGDGDKTSISATNGDWVRNGSTLSWVKGEADDALTIGLIADVKEASEANLKNLKAFVTKFKKAKVDMIAVAGDVAEKQHQIEAVLTTLAQSGLPVGVVIGNREGVGAFEGAVAKVQAKHSNVVNLNRVRRIDTPNADLVSLPGYYNKEYLHSADGCVYGREELDSLAALKAACNSPVVLISHGGPQQTGPDALDRTAQDANVGDPALRASLESLGIKFGVFANIHEAGGRGTDLGGAKKLENKEYDELYVNPGPADSVRYVMNDKTESTGMAAVMAVKGGKASFKVLRANN